MAIKMPVYLTLDVENREKAEQLLEHLASRMFLNRSEVADGIQTQLDAYRLPDYKKHKMYVFSLQIYAVKLRLHASLVGDQLVAATKPEILKQVIDASVNPLDAAPAEAHLLVRFNSRALHHLHDDFELYWVEKARQACHRNIISIYNLHRLYDASLDDIAKLSETKYGVRFYCREHGEYHYDEDHNQVVCSVHGNREHSKLYLDPDRQSSFKEFMSNLDEIVAYLRFQDEALIATLEIARKIKQ